MPLRLADCTDWNAAGVAEKLATVAQIEAVIGGPTGSPAGHGRTVSRQRGYEILEGWCEKDLARSFKIYKLYSRAVAFERLAEAYEKGRSG